MAKVTFDYSKANLFIREHEMESMKDIVLAAKDKLLARTGAGNDFLGWIDLPEDYDKDEFERIQKAADKIKADSDVLLVIGIGGSYLGARAAIEFLRHSFYNMISKEARKTPEIYFVGNSISSTYLHDLIDVIGERDFSVNIISKSGTTTEPAIAFRIFKEMLEKKYGKEEAAKRIYATTDKERGALKNLATEEGYESFVVPDDVGGRFSVLTAVGLLPIAASGADITKLMEGAASARKAALELSFEENDALKYAAVRNILHAKGKSVEVLANYETAFINHMMVVNPDCIRKRYNIEFDTIAEPHDVLRQIAEARGFKLKGDEPDLERASKILMDEYRGGKLGRLTLELPEDINDMLAEKEAREKEKAQTDKARKAEYKKRKK